MYIGNKFCNKHHNCKSNNNDITQYLVKNTLDLSVLRISQFNFIILVILLFRPMQLKAKFQSPSLVFLVLRPFYQD